ncbi:MAG: ATP-dependent DNA ligase [Candidatus Baltobacteraceae bacterium]
MTFEALPLKPPIEPMEARPLAKIPRGEDWIYEPKWDGFRCIAFRDGKDVALQSKSGQPLERYFPEVVRAVSAIRATRFVLDGEIAIEADGALNFDALLQRIHPAASRVERLATETPARYFVFDLLAENKAAVYEQALEQRRERLEAFAAKQFRLEGVLLSPATYDVAKAEEWFAGGTAYFDGVIAKSASAPYAFGKRDAAAKIKRLNTADCVVGGFRLSKDGKTIGSLLLGLYDAAGLLHLVGFVGSLNAAERRRAYELLKPIVQEPGFTGARPGGPSRWSKEQSEWFPVKPQVVVEVQYDHITAQRFRHGARFVRWRPDKAPQRCRLDQAFGI